LEAARKVGAEEADVYLLWGEPLAMVKERIADMRARAAAVGHILRFGLRIHVVVRETEKEAWAAAEDLIAHTPEGYLEAFDRLTNRTDSEGGRRQIMLRKEKGDLVLGPTSGRESVRAASASVRRSSATAEASPRACRSTSISASTRSSSPATRTGGGGALRSLRHAHFAGRTTLDPSAAPVVTSGPSVQMLAVAISGSPRSPSRSKSLAEAVLHGLCTHGCETRLIDLAALPAEGLLARGDSAEIDAAIAQVGEARIVAASNSYLSRPLHRPYRALSIGLLKCFFDLMPPGHLAGKVCVGLQTGTAAQHALAAEYGFRPLFASLDAVTAAVLNATDDEFEEGRPREVLLERLRDVASTARTLAS
jgi:NAD(P)H-dependent FMN reductase